MENAKFISIRHRLDKTQEQVAQLLGTSIQAIRSYEQGWRKIPPYVERQVLFLISRKFNKNGHKPCWNINKCSKELKENCPAWEFRGGDFCWLINGNFCKGRIQKNWGKKMDICRTCKVISQLM